jgi:hypothetical protein
MAIWRAGKIATQAPFAENWKEFGCGMVLAVNKACAKTRHTPFRQFFPHEASAEGL